MPSTAEDSGTQTEPGVEYLQNNHDIIMTSFLQVMTSFLGTRGSGHVWLLGGVHVVQLGTLIVAGMVG